MQGLDLVRWWHLYAISSYEQMYWNIVQHLVLLLACGIKEEQMSLCMFPVLDTSFELDNKTN